MTQLIKTIGNFINRAKYNILLGAAVLLVLLLSAYFGNNLFQNKPIPASSDNNEQILYSFRPVEVQSTNIDSQAQLPVKQSEQKQQSSNDGAAPTEPARPHCADNPQAVADRNTRLNSENAFHEQRARQLRDFYSSSYRYVKQLLARVLQSEDDRHTKAVGEIEAAYQSHPLVCQ